MIDPVAGKKAWKLFPESMLPVIPVTIIDTIVIAVNRKIIFGLQSSQPTEPSWHLPRLFRHVHLNNSFVFSCPISVQQSILLPSIGRRFDCAAADRKYTVTRISERNIMKLLEGQ